VTAIDRAETEDPGLSPDRFIPRTMGERLAGTPDPWAGMFRHRYDVGTARRGLAIIGPSPKPSDSHGHGHSHQSARSR
jgi:hypothetical protein